MGFIFSFPLSFSPLSPSPSFSPPNTFSHRVMARSKGSGNFKLRTVQLSPQSLLNRAPQSSSLAWKIEQACSGGKDDSGATLRPGSKERPPQAMPHSHGSDPPPLTTHRGLPHFMDEETKTEREWVKCPQLCSKLVAEPEPDFPRIRALSGSPFRLLPPQGHVAATEKIASSDSSCHAGFFLGIEACSSPITFYYD